MAPIVYLLCAATSLGCALLLLRSYIKSKTPLLFWSSACFVCLSLSNILLFVDLVVIPGIDLSILRSVITLAGLILLLFSFIWEER